MTFVVEVIVVEAIIDDESESLEKGDINLCIYDTHRERYINLEDPECQYYEHTVKEVRRISIPLKVDL